MRKRSLDQRFFKDPPTTGAWARLLFAGLWCLADKRGVLEDSPRWIKAEVFPHDDVDVEAELAALAAGNYIVRYEAEGMRLIWIPSFTKYQRPHPDERAAHLPEPPAKGKPSRKQVVKPPPGESAEIQLDSLGIAEIQLDRGEPKRTQLDSLESLPDTVVGDGVSDTEPETATAVAADRTRGPSDPIPFPAPGEREGAATERNGPATPRCIRGGCSTELRRETGRWRETSTGGVGWFCPRPDGGCGTVYPRGEPAILAQLSPRARAALDHEIQLEAGAREAAAEAALTPQTRALRKLVAELRVQQQPSAGEPPGQRNAAIAGAVWQRVVDAVKPLVPVTSFATWFRAPVALGILRDGEGDRLVVQVANAQAREWLSTHFRGQVDQAFREIGREDLGLTYVTAEEAAASPPLGRANGPPDVEASA